MEIASKTVVITGGASGIGAALAARCVAHDARVCIADFDKASAEKKAAELGCLGVACDVTDEDAIATMIATAANELGPIDIFVSNAGIIGAQPTHAASATNSNWSALWAVHVLAHVYAARALLPQMIERGSGYFVNVASAAGLLNQIGDAAYSATKHAAVSFADSLAITHGGDGIGVSVVCPQYVATPLIGLSDVDSDDRASLLTADQVARVIIAGIEAEKFMILPHSEVGDYVRLRAQDHDKWIKGMRKLRAKATSELGDVDAGALWKLL